MGQQELKDLKGIYEILTRKRIAYSILEQYYEGKQPVVYLTERLRDIFEGVDVAFTQNWCAVVVDSCKERINLRGMTSDTPTTQEKLDLLWELNDGSLEADDIHLYSLVFGEAYAVVEQQDDGAVEWYYNDPRLVHVEYEPDRPRVKRVAGKMWTETDDTLRLTLYYPDRIVYFHTEKKADSVTTAESFLPDPEAPDGVENSFGEIPVFHFRTARKPQSDLNNVIEPQNGINKLLADMMVAAEYGAFRQRYVISNAEIKGKLASEPGGLWELPASGDGEQNTAVGEFSATDLDNYLDAIDRLAGAIAIISRTPKHYLFSQTGTPSGEALIAMEAPLNKKAQDRIDRFDPEWRRLFMFMLKLTGIAITSQDLTPQFDTPETVQPKTEADITKIRIESGVPLEIALKWEGRSQSDIDAVVKAQKQAKKEAAAQRKTDLAAAASAFNAGVEQPGLPDGNSNPIDMVE